MSNPTCFWSSQPLRIWSSTSVLLVALFASATATGRPSQGVQLAGMGLNESRPTERSTPDAGAEKASALLERAKGSKALAQAAWDAAQELHQQAVRAREQSKTEQTAFNKELRGLAGPVRAASAARRQFVSNNAPVLRSVKAEAALALAAKEYDAAERLAERLVARLVALSASEERNVQIAIGARQKADEAKQAAGQAVSAAEALDKLARSQRSLVEIAWQARAEAAVAKAAASGASAVATLAARALELERSDALALRRTASANKLKALRERHAEIRTAAAESAALLAAGSSKGSCDVRRADFANFSYPGFRLKQGSALLSRDDLTIWIALRETVIGDLDGDGSPEALVLIESGKGLPSSAEHVAQASEYYAFTTDASCRVRSLDKVAGTHGRIIDNQFIVEVRGRRSEWRLANGRLSERVSAPARTEAR